MPINADQHDLQKKLLRQELERSMLLDQTDRDFWLANLPTLPLPVIENLLNIFQPANAQVDDWIETALAQDQNQEHLTELRRKVAEIKRNTFQLEEKGSTKKELGQEEDLLKQLAEADVPPPSTEIKQKLQDK